MKHPIVTPLFLMVLLLSSCSQTVAKPDVVVKAVPCPIIKLIDNDISATVKPYKLEYKRIPDNNMSVVVTIASLRSVGQVSHDLREKIFDLTDIISYYVKYITLSNSCNVSLFPP